MRAEELAEIIQRELRRYPILEIDGLGVFTLAGDGRITLSGCNRPRIFIAYASEDWRAAERLYMDLKRRGYSPWLDRRKLLPGQNWPRSIQDAIENSDFFIACFSRHSVNKRGSFQAEIRYALDCARRIPLDDVFFMPVRLDDCAVPRRIQREMQYIDLFPEWAPGVDKLCGVIERQGAKQPVS
jgi:hypothetical protein